MDTQKHDAGNTLSAKKRRKLIPRKEDAFYYIEVLHKNISFSFLAQASHSVGNTKLNGSFQGRRGCLVGEAGSYSAERLAMVSSDKHLINNSFYLNQLCSMIDSFWFGLSNFN